MKNIIKIFVAGLIGIGAISTTTLATVKNTVLSESANAAQHSANYDDYFYSGTYYDSIDFNAGNGLNGNLRKALTTLIKPSRTPNYSGSGSNTLSTTLQYADEDPTNSSNMVYFYTRNSVKKVAANPSSTWNREHVWPQSLSNNCWGQGDAGSDILHLRPTYEETNSSRGNLLYGYVTDSWIKTTKLVSGLTYCKKNGSYFEPLDSVKGDCARICMYVWVAWINYYGTSTMPALTKVFSSYNTLMEWHMIDPPDELEANRNSEAQYYQGNRNPFVDHPELAWKIFGEKCYDSIVRKAQVVYPETIPEITNLTYTGTLTNTIGVDGTDFTPTGVTVYANYSDGSSVNVTNDVVWKRLNSLENYVTGYYGRKSLKISGVTVNPYIKVTGIKFAQNKFECKVGDKLQLEASVLPENAINKSISYRSNNPDIATVDSNGLVTTLKAGKAAILAISSEGNKTAVCDILVQAPAGCTGSATSGSSILIFIAILGLGLLTLKKLKIKF